MNPGDAAPPRARESFGALLTSPGLLSITFWGASFVATRKALDGFTPEGVVATRFLLGAGFVASIAVLRRAPPWPKAEDLARSLLLGLVLAVHILLQAYALNYTSAIHSGWLVSFSAVGVTLGSVVFLGERLPRRNWIGVALAAFGVGLVIASKTPEFERATTGDALVFVSSFTWAGYTLLSKRPLASSGPWRVTPFVLAIAGALAWVASLRDGIRLPSDPGAGSDVALDAPTISVLFLGLFASGLAFLCWASTIGRFGALRAGLLVYLQPFVTLVLALWILGEPVGWSALVGGPVVLLGVALASRR